MFSSAMEYRGLVKVVNENSEYFGKVGTVVGWECAALVEFKSKDKPVRMDTDHLKELTFRKIDLCFDSKQEIFSVVILLTPAGNVFKTITCKTHEAERIAVTLQKRWPHGKIRVATVDSGIF